MKKYYLDNFIWNKETSEIRGLPRPYVKVNKLYYFLKPVGFKNKFKRYLHTVVPIPWQSIPLFDNFGALLDVNVDHESEVVKNGLCAYCGIKFKEKEICIRWTTQNFMPTIDGKSNNLDKDIFSRSRVFSDSYPHHLECMKQARIFCPFMRTLIDKNFETGEYDILKDNHFKHIKMLKNTYMGEKNEL